MTDTKAPSPNDEASADAVVFPAPDTQVASAIEAPQPQSAHAVPEPSPGHSWWREGLRAAFLLPIRGLPPRVGVGQLVLSFALISVVFTLLSRYEIAGEANFSARSWLFGWATQGLLLSGVWLLIHARDQQAKHTTPVAAWFFLVLIAAVPVGLVGELLAIGFAQGQLIDWWREGHWSAWLLYVLPWLWIVAIYWRVSSAIHASKAIVAALVVWSLAIGLLEGTTLRTLAWEQDYSADREDDEPFLSLSQEVFEKQRSLLEDALSGLKPNESDERQIYGVIFAPYNEDVFLRESRMVKSVLEERFGAAERVIQLVNNPSVTDEIPWATNLNLERTLKAISKAMNPEKDILVLYLTSHGGSDFKLATQHFPLEVDELIGQQLREMLDNAGIRNRVIAVSACYSGGWIEPLKDDNTLVMTAADKEHTSFGCGSKSELTFFGRAMFDEQLRKTLSFEDAFHAAVPLIRQREQDAGKDDGFSNPQIAVGENIRTILKEWADAR